MVSSTRIHSRNVCLSLRRWTATETKCSFCGRLGPTTELSSVCLQCGSSSQTEILDSSVLFHAHCFTCVHPPVVLFRYFTYFEKMAQFFVFYSDILVHGSLLIHNPERRFSRLASTFEHLCFILSLFFFPLSNCFEFKFESRQAGCFLFVFLFFVILQPPVFSTMRMKGKVKDHICLSVSLHSLCGWVHLFFYTDLSPRAHDGIWQPGVFV